MAWEGVANNSLLLGSVIFDSLILVGLFSVENMCVPNSSSAVDAVGKSSYQTASSAFTTTGFVILQKAIRKQPVTANNNFFISIIRLSAKDANTS